MDFFKPVFGTVTITLEDPRDPAVHGGGESKIYSFRQASGEKKSALKGTVSPD